MYNWEEHKVFLKIVIMPLPNASLKSAICLLFLFNRQMVNAEKEKEYSYKRKYYEDNVKNLFFTHIL